jgi:phosphonate transport system permease protein
MVYFFYRAETCLREGTVLGLLGVATLGGLVRESRAMDRYDEMMIYIAKGAVLVIVADLASLAVRRLWR